MPYSLDFALKTHPGLVRPLNEDSIGADPDAGLFILADGLGGYNAGEIASTMAVSSLLAELTGQLGAARQQGELFDPNRVLRDVLVAMNTTIYRAALNSAAFEGMATTVVLAWLLGPQLWVAHTGDSRLYRLRSGVLEQVTRDHSFSQELLDAGMVTEEEARLLPAKNLVTRALGANADVDPEVHSHDVRDSDILLLCSDGLTEMVSHHDIEATLAASQSNVAEAARRLVDLANEAGGRDNISVVVARITLDTAAESEHSEHSEHSEQSEQSEQSAALAGHEAGAPAAERAPASAPAGAPDAVPAVATAIATAAASAALPDAATTIAPETAERATTGPTDAASSPAEAAGTVAGPQSIPPVRT